MMKPVNLLLLFMTLPWGCRMGGGVGNSFIDEELQDRRALLALIGKDRLTYSDLKRSLRNKDFFIQERYQSAKLKMKYFFNMVNFEVMAREARTLGYHRHPLVVRAMKDAVLKVLWKQGRFLSPREANLSSEEMRKYYQAHIKAYSDPERVRLSQILLKLGKGWPMQERDKARRKARKVRDMMKGAKNPLKAFADLARKYSDDVKTRVQGGDMGIISRLAPPPGMPKSLLDAAFAMKQVGGLSDLVESGEGVHILQLTEQLNRTTFPFEQIKKKVKADLLKTRRLKALRRRYKALLDKAAVKLNTTLLRKLGIDSNWRGK